MVSDITIIIQEDSLTSDNTWSSSKVAAEIKAAKDSLIKYMEEDDLSRIDINITNIMPTEDKMKENTMYLVKVFDEQDFSQVLYYKIYMKFDDHIAFLGDSNIGQSNMYSKQESDDLFLCAQDVDVNDADKGLAAASIYKTMNHTIPAKLNNEDIYPLVCDRKNNSHAESFKIAIHNYTDRLDGHITYKVVNGFCHVKFELQAVNYRKFLSHLLEYQIIDDKTLPKPTAVLGSATPCTVLTTEAFHDFRGFVYITPEGGVVFKGDGVYYHTDPSYHEDIKCQGHNCHRIFRGSLIYPVI
jgi:hypothetical protein